MRQYISVGYKKFKGIEGSKFFKFSDSSKITSTYYKKLLKVCITIDLLMFIYFVILILKISKCPEHYGNNLYFYLFLFISQFFNLLSIKIFYLRYHFLSRSATVQHLIDLEANDNILNELLVKDCLENYAVYIIFNIVEFIFLNVIFYSSFSSINNSFWPIFISSCLILKSVIIFLIYDRVRKTYKELKHIKINVMQHEITMNTKLMTLYETDSHFNPLFIIFIIVLQAILNILYFESLRTGSSLTSEYIEGISGCSSG